MPAASVVIPTKNRPDLLAVTLRSILAQRGVDLDVVVVDDGSSPEVGRRLDALRAANVDVVHLPESAGVSAARNAAIARVRREWVAFCDDDDLWAPDKLARQLAALEERPAARWCFTGTIVFDERCHIVGHGPGVVDDALYRRLLVENVVPGGGSGVVARTELVRELGGFRPELRFGEDWEMWLRLARAAPVVAVDGPLLAYRVWTGAASSHVAIDEVFRLIEEANADEYRRYGLRPDRIGIELRRATDDAWTGRRLRSARRFLLLAALQRNPKKVAVAAMALAAPRSTYAHLTARSAAQVPEAWMQAMSGWLPGLLGVAPSVVRRA